MSARSIATRDSRCDGNEDRPSPTISLALQRTERPPPASTCATTTWMLLDPTSMAARRSSSEPAARAGEDEGEGGGESDGVRRAAFRPAFLRAGVVTGEAIGMPLYSGGTCVRR